MRWFVGMEDTSFGARSGGNVGVSLLFEGDGRKGKVLGLAMEKLYLFAGTARLEKFYLAAT